MITKAVRDPGSGAGAGGDDWLITGRKIWISRAAEADFTIVMAVTDPGKRARGGMSAFLVDREVGVFEMEMETRHARLPAKKGKSTGDTLS